VAWIGGATGSLLSLTPRPSVALAQSALYLSVGAVAAVAALQRTDPASAGGVKRLAFGLPAVALVFLSALGGKPFAETRVDVACMSAEPEVCVAPTYAFLTDDVVEAVAEPFAKFRSAGFAPPDRITQDLVGLSGTDAYLGIEVPSRDEVVGMLVFSVLPFECDIFRDRQTYQDYLDVDHWVRTLMGPVEGAFGVSDQVAGGDSPEARRHVRAISDRLAACGS
jgi:hypothetical protein